MPRRPVFGIIAVVVWSTLAVAAVAAAGTGTAVSNPAAIDTRPPTLVVTGLPANTVRWAGQTLDLSWTVGEDNPSTAPLANVAEIRLGDTVLTSQPFAPGSGPHAWLWTVADTTSGQAHLVVHSTDSFGNSSSARGEDFTILSAATDVPQATESPIFAPPAPNPFNPLTRLRFNLPSSGPVAVTVHDARGHLIATLRHGSAPAGPLTLAWDGRDHAGRRQAGGTYFFRLVCRDRGRDVQIVRKSVLLP